MNVERINQPGSVILTKWKAEREAARVKNSIQYVKSSDPAVLDLFGVMPASSGYAVNDASAMRVSAVSACIQLLGGTIASLPLAVYQRTEDGRDKIDSPLWYLLNEQPCPAWTAASMIEWWIRCNALRGDAFNIIRRDRAGGIIGIVPVHPDRMTPMVNDITGDILYRHLPVSGNARTYQDDEILHIPGFGYDGMVGRSLSVIKNAALSSIGIALAADDFSGKFFMNGASPKHLIKAGGKLSEDQIERLRNAYSERYTGPANVGKPMVLTEGLDVTTLSMSAVDAELLDSRKYQVIDIARAFGVPPFMIGANDTTTSWGTGIEQMTLGFVKFTLQAYLNRIEQEINRKFFKTSKYFVEFNLDGLLRGDSKSEGEFMRQSVGGSQGPGWMTINEIRRVKNLPSIEGGDLIYFPQTKGNDNAQAAPSTAS
jgi:HK97 family phage portal protein